MIACPYCGESRGEEEFSYGGEAHIARPPDPDSLTDEAWGDYLFFRKNTCGVHHEIWFHAAGCRRYFNMSRDTVNQEVLETYRIGGQPRFTTQNSKR